MRIVFRADDAGSSLGANRAIEETVRRGVVRNVSVMVPGPAFEDAVPMLRSLDADLGLHVTLSSEWDAPKWGPVLGAARAPSLVEADGSFTQNPGVLQRRGFSLDEAMAEVSAQLAKARAAGLEIAYLDEHMGVGWISSREERLTDRLRALCRAEGLVYAGDVRYLPDPTLLDEDGEGGPYVVVFHPGADDDPVMAGFLHQGLAPGQVHAERIADRKRLTGDEFRHHTSLTYREAIE